MAPRQVARLLMLELANPKVPQDVFRSSLSTLDLQTSKGVLYVLSAQRAMSLTREEEPPMSDRPSLSFAQVQAAMKAMIEKATQTPEEPVAMAIVDDTGNPRRLCQDGQPPAV